MKVLFIYPETPSTFWSFKNALKFIKKRSADPPLGLLTVSAMLPEDWERKLIDLNVTTLKDKDLAWADIAFISGMSIHKSSFLNIVQRCNTADVKVAAGGPLATVYHKELPGVDYFILNEAEITLPDFIRDLKKGTPKKVYSSEGHADISTTPVPDWGLLDMKRYSTIDIQYSRGCPFNCDFCSITMLLGKIPRVKGAAQFIAELEALYTQGWRGSVFVVDDNFIGNKKQLKTALLPALAEWSKERGYPFTFHTETSINISDDTDLMAMMVEAGFRMVFVGIETPDEKGLHECSKTQNKGRDLLESIKIIQRNGIEVSGGFIVGFDSDGEDIFDRQIRFIQKSGIVSAMVGLLNAPLGTDLYKRLKTENRIVDTFSGDNTDGSTNFITKMNPKTLNDGYQRIVSTIYSGKDFITRIKTFLKEYHRPPRIAPMTFIASTQAFFRAVFRLGIIERERKYFWNLLFHVLFNCPERLYIALRMYIYGFHFRKIAQQIT
jgi:radical SAM superfamily enzyme YgiQ (UPF0313 family)